MTAKKTTKKAATKRKVTKRKTKTTQAPKPGSKIEKTFKGKKITVQVTEDGFRYGGKTFASLTALAMHITGYKAVSGPRFFGLVEPKGGAK